jgi:hypothetical protein
MKNPLNFSQLTGSRSRAARASAAALGRELSKAQAVDIHLKAKQTFRLEGDQRGAHIHALAGNLWVTQRGDRDDYLLRPGESLEIDQAGLVLIQGLKASRFRLCLYY